MERYASLKKVENLKIIVKGVPKNDSSMLQSRESKQKIEDNVCRPGITAFIRPREITEAIRFELQNRFEAEFLQIETFQEGLLIGYPYFHITNYKGSNFSDFMLSEKCCIQDNRPNSLKQTISIIFLDKSNHKIFKDTVGLPLKFIVYYNEDEKSLSFVHDTPAILAYMWVSCEKLREMIETYRWSEINKKISSVKEDLDINVIKLDGRMNNLEERLSNVEGRLSNVEERLGNVEERLGNVEEKLSTIEINIINTIKKMEKKLKKYISRAIGNI